MFDYLLYKYNALYFQPSNIQLHTITCICLLLGSDGVAAKPLNIQNNPNLPDDDTEDKQLSVLHIENVHRTS